MDQDNQRSNLSNGLTSYDSELSGSLINFFNRNVSEYPTEVGGPKFDLIPVAKQKDIMINVARLHAQQEYNRIMDLVSVLQKQAEQIKRRLDITDQVHAAEYQFQLYHNKSYWLVFNTKKQKTILSHNGPNDWSCGSPEEYQYIAKVKWLGDHTWIEVDDKENPIW